MSRKKFVDMEVALDLLDRGETIPVIATELGISQPTLRARIADLSKKQGVLLQYREIQSLQLTELQARCLEAITPDKIENASLRDLVMSYKILKDKEQVIEGKPSEIKGLVAHLVYMEKQEGVVKDHKETDFEDAGFTDETAPEVLEKDFSTRLAEIDDNDFSS